MTTPTPTIALRAKNGEARIAYISGTRVTASSQGPIPKDDLVDRAFYICLCEADDGVVYPYLGRWIASKNAFVLPDEYDQFEYEEAPAFVCVQVMPS